MVATTRSRSAGKPAEKKAKKRPAHARKPPRRRRPSWAAQAGRGLAAGLRAHGRDLVGLGLLLAALVAGLGRYASLGGAAGRGAADTIDDA
ncbi:MAG: hypothetical protein ACKVWR_20270, partial [Acidimicrobiales bacterium]